MSDPNNYYIVGQWSWCGHTIWTDIHGNPVDPNNAPILPIRHMIHEGACPLCWTSEEVEEMAAVFSQGVGIDQTGMNGAASGAAVNQGAANHPATAIGRAQVPSTSNFHTNLKNVATTAQMPVPKQGPAQIPSASTTATATASPGSVATPGVSSLTGGALKVPVKPQSTVKSPACQRCRHLKQKCEGIPCERCERKGVRCSLVDGEGEDEEDEDED